MRIPSFTLETADPKGFASSLSTIRRDEMALFSSIVVGSQISIDKSNPTAASQVKLAERYLDLGMRGHAEKLLFAAAALADDQPRYAAAPWTTAALELRDLHILNGATAHELFDQRAANERSATDQGFQRLASLLCQAGRFDEAAKALRDATEKLDGDNDNVARFVALAETMEAFADEVVAHDNEIAPVLTAIY